MPVLSRARRTQAQSVAALAATNPFTDAWTEREARALGPSFRRRAKPWSHGHDDVARGESVALIEALTRDVCAELRHSVAKGGAALADVALYREVALYDLYHQTTADLDALLVRGATSRVTSFRPFAAAFDAAFDTDPRARPAFDAAHAFAGFFQIRRAFFHTFRFLIGTSLAAARLRAGVWDAIFTSDAARYRRALVDRMKDVPTLVLGPTGTGKELVARAIGLSGFVPFLKDKLAFAGDPHDAFAPLHLQALAPTLVESELFGHKRGAFTGALEDRRGVFASCPPWGTVFFDEIGELDPSLQTKLLRVLESRDFTPLGANAGQRFVGRVVAATNRDLAVEVAAGRFRRDLYFRIAGVVVQTPSLAQRIAEDESELPTLVAYLAEQIAGKDEAPSLRDDVLRATAQLPKDYAWPGNVRELAQCVRSVLVRGAYRPEATATTTTTTTTTWLDAARAGRLTADELLTGYAKHVHAAVGTYEGTARVLGLDRRTVKARVD